MIAPRHSDKTLSAHWSDVFHETSLEWCFIPWPSLSQHCSRSTWGEGNLTAPSPSWRLPLCVDAVLFEQWTWARSWVTQWSHWNLVTTIPSHCCATNLLIKVAPEVALKLIRVHFYIPGMFHGAGRFTNMCQITKSSSYVGPVGKYTSTILSIPGYTINIHGDQGGEPANDTPGAPPLPSRCEHIAGWASSRRYQSFQWVL